MSNQELAVERSYAQLLFMISFSCVINHLPYPLFSSSCIFTVCMMLSWCNPFVHLNLLNHKYLFLRCSFRSRSIARVIHLVISTNTSLCFFCASCWVSSLAQMVLLTKRPRVVYCYYLCNHMTSTYTYQPSRNPQLYLYFFSLTGYCYFYLHCSNAFCGKNTGMSFRNIQEHYWII